MECLPQFLQGIPGDVEVEFGVRPDKDGERCHDRDGYQGEIYPPEFQEFEVRADYRHVRKQRYEPCRDRGHGGINGGEFHGLRDAPEGGNRVEYAHEIRVIIWMDGVLRVVCGAVHAETDGEPLARLEEEFLARSCILLL